MSNKEFIQGKNHIKITVQDGWCEYEPLNEVLQVLSESEWTIHFVDNGNISCTKERSINDKIQKETGSN